MTVGNELPGAQPADTESQLEGFHEEGRGDHELRDLPRHQDGGRGRRTSEAPVRGGPRRRRLRAGGRWTARLSAAPANDIERIATLVRTAIGYDKDRGDQVEVVNLRFAETPAPVEFTEPSLIQSFLAPSKEDVMRMVELSVLLILTVIVLMAVVRPLLRRVLASEPAQAILMAGPALAGGEPGPDQVLVARDNPTARLVDFAQLNGKVQAETVQRVVDMVRGSPSETVEVLRNWIHDS